jgi:hypothetical protein
MEYWSVAVIPTNECSKNNIASGRRIVADSPQTDAVGLAIGAVLVPLTDAGNAIHL